MDNMCITKENIYNFAKTMILELIYGVLANFISNGFDITKFSLDSLIYTFKEFWFLFLILFLLTLMIFKVHEKPKFLYVSHSKARFFSEGYIIHNNILWKIVVEEKNPLYDFYNPKIYHYYISKPICIECANKEKPSFVELERRDLLFCYLEKCYKCNSKKLRFKSFDREKYELQIFIDGEIEASITPIYTGEDLVNLFRNIQEI